jgi:hypothetical protein
MRRFTAAVSDFKQNIIGRFQPEAFDLPLGRQARWPTAERNRKILRSTSERIFTWCHRNTVFTRCPES